MSRHGDSIRQFINELDAFQQKGIADDELSFMRQAINQSDATKIRNAQC